MEVNLTFELLKGRYAYTTSPTSQMPIFAQINETESTNYIVALADNQNPSPTMHFVCKALKLTPSTSLNAVGITAKVSTQLSSIGISCNVIAGLYHDYFFVPESKATQALVHLQEVFGNT